MQYIANAMRAHNIVIYMISRYGFAHQMYLMRRGVLVFAFLILPSQTCPRFGALGIFAKTKYLSSENFYKLTISCIYIGKYICVFFFNGTNLVVSRLLVTIEH